MRPCEAMAWFAANYKAEEEECVMQEFKEQGPGIIACPQKLPSLQWICPGCGRRTRQWDCFYSPILKGRGQRLNLRTRGVVASGVYVRST